MVGTARCAINHSGGFGGDYYWFLGRRLFDQSWCSLYRAEASRYHRALLQWRHTEERTAGGSVFAVLGAKVLLRHY